MKHDLRSFTLGSRLVSFDAVSMYTRITVNYTIGIMLALLRDAQIHQSICFFMSKIYKFQDGLPMRGPLSALVANAYMDHIEKQILNSKDPGVQCILFYKRYVDDILCVWNGSDDLLQHTLDVLNVHHPSMEYTL